MSNIMAGSLGGVFPAAHARSLSILSLLINNSCNLTCRHCYLEAPKSGQYLKHDEWMQFLTSVFADLRPEIICFAGKEAFHTRESVRVLLDAVRLRNKLQTSTRRSHIGVITNGTLLHHYRHELLEVSPDHWDVSLDGLPTIHDEIRGKGAFAQLEPNLEWLVENFSDRIWITHTVMEPNIDRLLRFVAFYHKAYGLRNFSLGFYRPTSYTDNSLELTAQHYYQFVQTLPKLAEIELDSPVRLTFEFDSAQMDMIDLLTANGWADPVDDIAAVSHPFDNGLTLSVRTIRIPVGLWRSARVTADGFYVAAEDTIYAQEFARRAVANVRDFEFDAVRLYQAGVRHLASSGRQIPQIETIARR